MIGKIRKIVDRSQIHASYLRVFETPDGERVLKHLMKKCFMFTSTFVAGDPHQTALNEGSRRAILSILTFLGRDQNKLDEMIQEGLQENET